MSGRGSLIPPHHITTSARAGLIDHRSRPTWVRFRLLFRTVWTVSVRSAPPIKPAIPIAICDQCSISQAIIILPALTLFLNVQEIVAQTVDSMVFSSCIDPPWVYRPRLHRRNQWVGLFRNREHERACCPTAFRKRGSRAPKP